MKDRELRKAQKSPSGSLSGGMLSVFLIFPPQRRQLLSGMSPTMMTKSLGLPFSSFHFPKPTR